MGLLRFILGVLGILLIIGAFSSFLPLFFLGGIATGSAAFAFGFPIFLMILGALMVYFGFYYINPVHNSNSQLMEIVKWGIAFTIGIFLGNYIINRLMITSNFWGIILATFIVSIISQIMHGHESHDYKFNGKWFIFYFFLYANIIWAISEFILPNLTFQTGILSALVVGFSLAGAVVVVQKIKIKNHSVNWITFILLILLLVANLESLSLPSSFSIKPFLKLPANTSALSEDKQVCPTFNSVEPLIKAKAQLNSDIALPLNNLIDKSVWRIEANIRSCYQGRYKGQYPEWYYCDDMIVSRWETSSSGTINYRWYTAVSSEWEPTPQGRYSLHGFVCENGQKVTVDKEKTNYYVHVSRDGTEIKIEY